MVNEVSVNDLISLAYDQKPIDFQNTFDQLIKDKLVDAIDNKKIEMAKTMFGGIDNDEVELDNEFGSENQNEQEYEFDQEEEQDGETAE